MSCRCPDCSVVKTRGSPAAPARAPSTATQPGGAAVPSPLCLNLAAPTWTTHQPPPAAHRRDLDDHGRGGRVRWPLRAAPLHAHTVVLPSHHTARRGPDGPPHRAAGETSGRMLQTRLPGVMLPPSDRARRGVAVIEARKPLCALCGAPAASTVDARGANHLAAPVCSQCLISVVSGSLRLGWCEPGHHYGRPSQLCRRHRVRFVGLNARQRGLGQIRRRPEGLSGAGPGSSFRST
jgi:hypothetical protein